MGKKKNSHTHKYLLIQQVYDSFIFGTFLRMNIRYSIYARTKYYREKQPKSYSEGIKNAREGRTDSMLNELDSPFGIR